MPQSPRVSAALGVGLLALALPGTAHAAPLAAKGDGTSVVTVVHGVRGLVADVKLDGKLVLSGFAPERVTDPLTVPAGEHRVQIWRSGSDQQGPPLLDATVDLPAGGRSTAGVGTGPGGKPFLALYDDDELLPDLGSTTIAVRGLADASDVTVTADGETIAESLDPRQEESERVDPGTYEVTALDGDSSRALVTPQDVPVTAGRAVVLYLIGSEQDKTLGWVAQTVRPGTSGAPQRMDTGVGPLPEQDVTRATVPASLLAGTASLLLAGAVRARRRDAER